MMNALAGLPAGEREALGAALAAAAEAAAAAAAASSGHGSAPAEAHASMPLRAPSLVDWFGPTPVAAAAADVGTRGAAVDEPDAKRRRADAPDS